MTRPDAEDLNLDSTCFVAFEMAHAALKRGLASASPLNVTQYRMLVKLLEADGQPVSQSRLGAVLGLKPNVVTQALRALTGRGLATSASGDDARTRLVAVSQAGASHVDEANAAIVRALYEVFPTYDVAFRVILEAAIEAGAVIDPPLRAGAKVRHPASRALVSVELIRQETERTLKEACGASFNECRVLQRLCEVARPLRIGALASQIDLSAVNVARAVDRLEGRGWARRLGSTADKKAVYAQPTDEGLFQGQVIDAAVNELARTRLWANLAPEQRRAISQVGHVVVAAMREREERAEIDALETLRPR